MSENFYEKMHLDKLEADNFEPPYDDRPYGEEQERIDAQEGGGDTESFDRVAWLSKQDDLLGEGWDD